MSQRVDLHISYELQEREFVFVVTYFATNYCFLVKTIFRWESSLKEQKWDS